MLRVTESKEVGSYVMIVEGELTGATLGPLAELLRRLPPASEGGKRVIFDLTGVTSIDAEGKQLLARLHAQGASFRAKGCLNRAIVEGITCCQPESAGAGARPEGQVASSGQGEKK